MSTILSKSSILKKTFEVASSTLMSRVLGIIRETLSVRYLGAGMASDAFLTAFRLPNTLRKIFAEGALSAAFVPTLVKVVRQEGKEEANRLMSLAFLIFEGLVLLLCALAMWQAEFTIKLMAPGFSAEKIAFAVPLLRILMPFIFFISSSALLAGALQSVGHFFVPAFSPVLLNVFFITGLVACWTLNLPVTHLCFFILFGGLVQFIGHLVAYFKLGFAFGAISIGVLRNFGSVLANFLLGSISMSVVEINLFIDSQFASYLPEGSVSLIYYANRFMGIPLGVFAVAFSTILLPHFSRITAYAPKRLSFYLLETSKFVAWVTIPATLMMCFFAQKFFATLFLSEKFTMAQAVETGHILIAFTIGLLFFSLNKIILSMYYALHAPWIPAMIAAFGAIINIVLDYILIEYWQATGLALATTISAIVQTICLVALFRSKFSIVLFRKRFVWESNFKLYIKQFALFIWRYTLQLSLIFSTAFALYYGIELWIATSLSMGLKNFLLFGLGFWFWVGPLCGLTFLALFYSRKWFNVQLYFLD
ncbi:MAG TPA: murein biosynthesis integral membrane protein MurJ [Candidatus Babeliales bacterium]|nr:murein biosynthesis integral membrane protein MurJ [Candidatus Babeliales bacterium]